MTAPPAEWIPALTAFAVRVMALVGIITLFADFAHVQDDLRAYFGNQYIEAALRRLEYILLSAAACAVLALLAPALAAWSQMGARRAAGPGEIMDRASRALIVVMAAASLLTPLVNAPGAVLHRWRHFAELLERHHASMHILNEPMIAAFLAILVILLTPALGAALNAARRALQGRAAPQAPA